jgi:hypothetical protein
LVSTGVGMFVDVRHSISWQTSAFFRANLAPSLSFARCESYIDEVITGKLVTRRRSIDTSSAYSIPTARSPVQAKFQRAVAISRPILSIVLPCFGQTGMKVGAGRLVELRNPPAASDG